MNRREEKWSKKPVQEKEEGTVEEKNRRNKRIQREKINEKIL